MLNKNYSVAVLMKRVLVLGSLFFALSSQSQELQTYIQEAVGNNPEISSFELRYKIANEKIAEVDALPNTNLSLGYFVSEPETRTGAQRARVSVSQMLPWFGTITARENYSGKIAEAAYVEIAIAKRKLTLSVAQSYYALYANAAKQKVLDQNMQLLKTFEQLALTSVEVGKASVVEVLKLQIRQNGLKQQKQVLEEEYLAERAAFNILRSQSQSGAVNVVANLELPTEDLVYSDEAILLNPELVKYDKLYESVAQSELVNQKERLPSVGFGLDYIPVSERSDMSLTDNGKDIIMPMVSFAIPIFNNGYKSVSRQNELKQLEIASQKQQRFNALKTVLATAISQRNQARITYDIQEKSLKQAKDVEHILTKNYETGTIDFNELLDIQELQLQVEINRIEAIKTYYKQSSIINYLIL